MRFKTLIMIGATVLSSCLAAHADSFSFTILNPTQTATPGQTVDFVAKIAASSSNSGDVYLNSDSYSFTSPLAPDVSSYSSFPTILTPDQSFTGLLFDINVPLYAPMGVFKGSFYIFGGADPTITTNLLGTQSYAVTVTSTGSNAVTPEPSSIALLGTGLLGIVGVIRKRFA